MNSLEIRNIRKNLKKTQAEFAELLKVSKNSVQLWETNKRNPSESIKLLITSIYEKHTKSVISNIPILREGGVEIDLDKVFQFILKNEDYILKNHNLFKLWISEKVYKGMAMLSEDLKSGKVKI